jgi:arylsulfatase A-like enzyme
MTVAESTSESPAFSRSLAARGRLAWSEFAAISVCVTFGTILVEVAVRVALRVLCTPYRWGSIDPLAFYSHAAYWIMPVADGLTFLLLSITLAPVVAFLDRRQALSIVSFFLLWLAFFAGLWTLTTRLHLLAVLMLEVGIAVAATRLVLRYDPASLSLARRAMLPLGTATLLLAVAVPAWRAWQEYRVEATLSPPTSSTPNVLLITLDTVRAENLDLYGYSRQTAPHLTSLAAEGTTFNGAMAPCCWTLPTHASLFTGTLPHENQADYPNGFTAEMATLAGVLRGAGLVSAGFYANVWNCGVHTGLGRGFVHYEDYEPDLGLAVLASPLFRPMLPNGRVEKRKTAADVNNEFLRWLDRREGRQFFVFLNYYDAHLPYETPDPQFDRFTSVPLDKRKEFRARLFSTDAQELLSKPELLQGMVDAYDGSIAYIDQQLHELFDQFDRRSVLRNTLVIVTSDHGEHFGEHSILMHGESMYRQEIDVPLVIWKPGLVPAAQRIEQPVSLADVPQTILNLLGLPEQFTFPGNTLARHWQTGQIRAADDVVVVAGEVIPTPHGGSRLWHTGAIRSVFADGLHYLRNERLGTEDLYDMRDDPRELTNLVSRGRAEVSLDRLRNLANDVFGVAPPATPNSPPLFRGTPEHRH